MIEKNFRCPYCERSFTRKPWYEKHACESKRRFLARNNINTVLANRLYNYWMKKLVKRKRDSSVEEFQKVREYKLFMRLAEFCRLNYLVSNVRYVDWLIETKCRASRWTHGYNLNNFREWMRNHEDPVAQVDITHKNVTQWCRDNNLPKKDFFKYVPPVLALEMIRENRLLPWVLFGHRGSEDQLIPRFTQDLMYEMDDFLNASHWIDKVTRETKSLDLVRVECERLFNESA